MAYSRSEVEIDGTEDLIKDLKGLGVNVRKSLRGVMRAGARVIGDAAEAAAPKSHVKGKKIAVAIVAATPDRVTAAVGPNKKHWYLRFAETGTSPHEIAGNPFLRFFSGGQLLEVRMVQHPGSAARPFLRPAFDAQGDQAVQVVGESLRQVVEDAKVAAEGEDD